MSLDNLEKELYGQKRSSREVDETTSQPKKNTTKREIPAVKKQSPWEMNSVVSGKAFSGAAGLFGRYGKVLIVVLIVLLIISLGIAGFYVYQFFTTKETVLRVNAPSEVLAGVPFSVSLSFENNSSRDLYSPAFSVALPAGVVATDNAQQRVVSFGADVIGAGEAINHDFSLVVVGDVQTTYDFRADVAYSYDQSTHSNRFNTHQDFSVLAKDSVIALDLSAPQSVLNGEDFEIHLRYQNVGSMPLENVRLHLTLPDSFKLNNSDPTLTGDTITIPSFAVGGDFVAILSGSVVTSEGSFFEIGASALLTIGGSDYTISSRSAPVSVTPSPLALILDSDVSGDVVKPGDVVTYTATYTNNTSIALTNVILALSLDGAMVDTAHIQTDGYYNDASGTFTWTASQIGALANLAPGQSGSVSLRVPLKSSYPVRTLADKDFVVSLSGVVSSPSVPAGVTASKTIGLASLSLRVGGSMALSWDLYFNDPKSNFVNKGSLPPRVGQEIQYTLHVSLGALGADVSGGIVHIALGPGVRWTAQSSMSGGSVPEYNDRTQEFTWDVGDVGAGAGLVSDAPELVVQFAYTPSSLDVGNRFVIVKSIDASGHDTFVDASLSALGKVLYSDALSDLSLPLGYARVTQ